MNLFWNKLFGKLESTAKMEANEKQLLEDYNRYIKVGQSPEYEEYQELYKLVKSSQFKENKKTLTSRKYKDTQYYRDSTKFKKLQKDVKLNNYFKIIESNELAEYLEFKTKPEYTLLGNPKKVRKDPNLKRLKTFEKSKDYKTYTRFHNSYILKEYGTLTDKVNSDDFIKMNNFWADEKRWEKTKEANLEKRYFELSSNADIKFYNDQDPKRFENFETYEKTFNEQFAWKTLDKSSWVPGFSFGNDTMKSCYSFANEKQANNNGKNVSKHEGDLVISTKKEEVKATAWDSKKGFIEKTFEYTSDIINAKEAVYQKEGIFRAKMKFKGSKDITHAFWLINQGPTPQINIVKYNGKYLKFGIHWNNNQKVQESSTKITGINPEEFFIYTFKWTESEMSWYINNVKVYETLQGLPDVPMFPVLSSHIGEKKHGGIGEMEVKWIEVYSKK